jgi:hypothetical protein
LTEEVEKEAVLIPSLRKEWQAFTINAHLKNIILVGLTMDPQCY